MKTFIKICGLRDAADVQAAAEAGANAVGFVFTESLRRVTPEQAKAATVGLQPGVRRVAVMRHPEQALCREVMQIFQPDVIQTDRQDFADLDIPDDIECWPVIREGEDAIPPTGIYVYEGSKSGSGETVDWSRAARLAKRGLMLLAGGLAEDNVREAIETVQPWGVDVSSGVESLPGTKDHELIKRFIGAVRALENIA